MRRAVLAIIFLAVACSPVAESTWFTMEGVSVPGEARTTGSVALDLQYASDLQVDLHLRNSGAAPGTSRGTGIRGFGVRIDYGFPPGMSPSISGFSQTAVGYLPAPGDEGATTVVLGGISLLTPDRVENLRDEWDWDPFTMQAVITVTGQTDEGTVVETKGGVTILVGEIVPTPTIPPTPTPTRTPTPTPTPLPAVP